ncbi:MAG: insulinase family protein [Ruminococcus callidus]
MAETTKKTIVSPQTGDKYTHIHHKSGLEILVCEMEGYSTTEAMFGTKYGSINTQFKTAADKDYCTVPEGIAHFLEHKLFENEDCDVFDLYAKTGANANAFTSFDKTCYFFSCSDNFKASLEILLSLSSRRTSRRKALPRNRALSGRRSACATTTPAGGYSSTCCAVCTRSIRFASTSPAPLRVLRKLQTICCTAATARSTTSTTWYWQLPESARWTRCWRLPTGC